MNNEPFPSEARIALRMYLASEESTLPTRIEVRPGERASIVHTVETTRYEFI